MRGMLKAVAVFAAVASVWAPQTARADSFINLWAGRQFPSTADQGRGAFGVTVGGTGTGVVGGELELGYSPSFFGTQNDFGHNTVIDLTVNVTIGMPLGDWRRGAAVRPFARVGAGLIRTQIDGGSVNGLPVYANMYTVTGNSIQARKASVTYDKVENLQLRTSKAVASVTVSST